MKSQYTLLRGPHPTTKDGKLNTQIYYKLYGLCMNRQVARLIVARFLDFLLCLDLLEIQHQMLSASKPAICTTQAYLCFCAYKQGSLVATLLFLSSYQSLIIYTLFLICLDIYEAIQQKVGTKTNILEERALHFSQLEKKNKVIVRRCQLWRVIRRLSNMVLTLPLLGLEVAFLHVHHQKKCQLTESFLELLPNHQLPTP